MKWFGSNAEIEILEREDGMQVRVTRQRTRFDFLIRAVVLVVLGFLFWRNRSCFYLLVLLGVITHSVIDWVGNDQAELWITEKDLEAIGKIGGISHPRIRLPWASISGLEYREGGEDEPSGLYARRGGWSSTRIMTYVNKEQAEEIISAIYRRFPYVEMAEDSGGWLPLGGKSGLTTLGLSKSGKSSREDLPF
jgi:hypothetical protein